MDNKQYHIFKKLLIKEGYVPTSNINVEDCYNTNFKKSLKRCRISWITIDLNIGVYMDRNKLVYSSFNIDDFSKNSFSTILIELKQELDRLLNEYKSK